VSRKLSFSFTFSNLLELRFSKTSPNYPMDSYGFVIGIHLELPLTLPSFCFYLSLILFAKEKPLLGFCRATEQTVSIMPEKRK
jgi:hypothetical protein